MLIARKLRVACGISAGGDITAGGDIRAGGDLSVNGNLTVGGTGSFGGDVSIGDCVLTCSATGLVVTSTSGSVTVGGGASAYGYVYNTDGQSVAIDAPVYFNSNGPLLGVTHVAAADPTGFPVNIVAAGVYSISFSVSGVEASQFAIFVNGTAAASTIYGSGAGTQQNTGQAILTLGAGDVITLVNHSSAAAVTLQTPSGGTESNVTASLLIMKLA